MVNNTTQVDSTTGKTKRSKPLIEKRRRTRINNCLSQLKKLVLQATGRNSESALNSKLEKADILEMTVQYLETIRKGQHQNQTPNKSPEMSKYQSGYTLCTSQAFKYLELSNRQDLNSPSSSGAQVNAGQMCDSPTLLENGIQNRLSNHLNLLQNSFGSNSAYTSTHDNHFKNSSDSTSSYTSTSYNRQQNNYRSMNGDLGSSSAYTCATNVNRFQNSLGGVSPLYSRTSDSSVFTNSSCTQSRSTAKCQQGNRNDTILCESSSESLFSGKQINRNSPTLCETDCYVAIENTPVLSTVNIDDNMNVQNNNTRGQQNECNEAQSENVWRPW